MFSGLAAGTYTGYVKDSKGCIGQLEGIVVGPTNCAPLVANNAKGIVTATVEPLVSSLKVQAYPNPSTDEFTLVLSGYNMNEKVSVVISDVMGRKVYQAEGTGKQQSGSVNLSLQDCTQSGYPGHRQEEPEACKGIIVCIRIS